MEPNRLTATETLRLLRENRLHPRDLLDSCLARIAEREPVIHAFAHHDPAEARHALAASGPGPLQGLPIGVKDVLDTANHPAEYGSPIWKNHRPRADSAPVAWAKAAGAYVIGKTVTTEFATRKPGPTANPHNPNRTPGGSSSGSAAGVADFFFPLAYGTQTAGSVIRPAAYCGIAGYKPSFGLINRFGMKLMSDTLDTVGVMARSVADCALFAGAVSGRDLGNPETRPDRAPRIGICQSPSWPSALPETHSLLPQVADALRKAGAHIQDRELPPPFPDLIQAHPIIMNHESARALGWELANHRDQISPELQERLDFGLSQPESALTGAYATFNATRAAFPAATEGLDILITPAAPGQAPEGLHWTGDPAFNFIWTSLGVPCVTVPAGTGPDNMPLGIQIVGRAGEDRQVLSWSAWIAAALS